jgi:hypothetical protein
MKEMRSICFCRSVRLRLARYLPRIYGSLEPLEKLPIKRSVGGFEGALALLTGPEFRKMARTLAKAAREQQAYRKTIGSIRDDLPGWLPPHSQFGEWAERLSIPSPASSEG